MWQLLTSYNNSKLNLNEKQSGKLSSLLLNHVLESYKWLYNASPESDISSKICEDTGEVKLLTSSPTFPFASLTSVFFFFLDKFKYLRLNNIPRLVHCVKSVHIQSYSGPYSVQMWKNADQNKSKYGHFSRSDNRSD